MLPRLAAFGIAAARLSQLSRTFSASPITRSFSTTSGSMAPPYNDLTLYTFGTPNGLKPAITFEELGLKYECHKVDITKNEQKEQWFLDINPNGRIPALKDGNLRVFESGAMMLYATDKYDPDHKISYPNGTDEYYEMLSWLMFQVGGLGPMQGWSSCSTISCALAFCPRPPYTNTLYPLGQAGHFLAMAGARSDYGIKRYLDETKRLFSVLEIRLKDHDWLVGDKYTLADIANYAWVAAGPRMLELDLNGWPGVKKWHDKIDKREAVQKAYDVPKRTRSPEEMEEMFKNMRAKVAGMKNEDKH